MKQRGPGYETRGIAPYASTIQPIKHFELRFCCIESSDPHIGFVGSWWHSHIIRVCPEDHWKVILRATNLSWDSDNSYIHSILRSLMFLIMPSSDGTQMHLSRSIYRSFLISHHLVDTVSSWSSQLPHACFSQLLAARLQTPKARRCFYLQSMSPTLSIVGIKLKILLGLFQIFYFFQHFIKKIKIKI